MKVRLPRKMIIDLDNVPEDFEKQIQDCFKGYTEITNPDYMFHDKLCFIDLMVKYLHNRADSEDEVMDLMQEQFKYMVRETDEFPDEDCFRSAEFMEDCFRRGVRKSELYSHEWSKDQRKHDDDKIMRLLCRAIKAVMDYEWGCDGV